MSTDMWTLLLVTSYIVIYYNNGYPIRDIRHLHVYIYGIYTRRFIDLQS